MTVTGQPRPFLRDAFKILSATPVKLSPGGTVRVRVSAPPGNFFGRFKLELDNAPAGISLTNVFALPAGLELAFSCDAEKAKPGSSGNLICEVVPKNPALTNLQQKQATPNAARPMATLPAIPFTISEE